MLYLSRFTFPDDGEEFDFLLTIKRKCYDSFYPFKVLSAKGVRELDLEPVTVLYGGNGSGKTTALNVMAETLKLRRDSRYNRSIFLRIIRPCACRRFEPKFRKEAGSSPATMCSTSC